jgi:hypothetical protein
MRPALGLRKRPHGHVNVNLADVFSVPTGGDGLPTGASRESPIDMGQMANSWWM